MYLRNVLLISVLLIQVSLSAQQMKSFSFPSIPDTAARNLMLKQQWAALHRPIPGLGVRDCYLFLADALEAKFLTQEEILWTLQLLKTRVITDPQKPSYGNMYWGWTETGGDVGDGNNVEFCVQFGSLIKILFDDQLSPKVKAALDDIFDYALQGIRRQPVRVSYTNIYLMRVWNFLALGQIYHQPSVVEESRKSFDTWLKHVANYGNREYDSPTYCGVDLESLLLIYRFSKDKDIQTKAAATIQFFLTDLGLHFNQRAGILEGAHSRDYNRVFSRDHLENRYFNPLFGGKDADNHLFTRLCLSVLKEIGFNPEQKKMMAENPKFVIQKWDSLPHTFAYDYRAKKFSIASSNQAYSPDDKTFVIYLSSPRIAAMPNITYVAEGRDDHYGTWQSEGKGDLLKHLMPPNYPANGGWNKTRHLMPFMQTVQRDNEFVMLVSGEKDHNCIHDYLNSTVILPNYFDQIWIGDKKLKKPFKGDSIPFDNSNTLFGRFEDVAVAFRILWSNADQGVVPHLIDDGFQYKPSRENFDLTHNEALRFTMQHPHNGTLKIAMWWKAEEGIDTDQKFEAFRRQVLQAPVTIHNDGGILDLSVATNKGTLGLKADLNKKIRLAYYGQPERKEDFLLLLNGKEIGHPLMANYR